MTHRPIRTLEDGTRVYSSGMKYRPVPDGQRKYRRHKPDSDTAVRWGNHWYEPLVLLPEDARKMPETSKLYDRNGRQSR